MEHGYPDRQADGRAKQHIDEQTDEHSNAAFLTNEIHKFKFRPKKNMLDYTYAMCFIYTELSYTRMNEDKEYDTLSLKIS